MKTLLWIFLALGLIYTVTATAQNKIDPAFFPYMQRFVKEANLRHVRVSEDSAEELSIKLASGMIRDGYCKPNDHKITIRKSYWEALSDSKKEEYLFFMLGGCLLGRETSQNRWIKENGLKIPRSIMANSPEELFTNNFYNKYHEHYMNELFSGVN